MVSSWKFLSGLRILVCLVVFSNVIMVVCLSQSLFVFGVVLVLIMCLQVLGCKGICGRLEQIMNGCSWLGG
jgi:hypothetical protein